MIVIRKSQNVSFETKSLYIIYTLTSEVDFLIGIIIKTFSPKRPSENGLYHFYKRCVSIVFDINMQVIGSILRLRLCDRIVD